MDYRSPEEKALLNPLILAELLKYSTRGKVLRQVCQLWNEFLLISPSPQVVLHPGRDRSKTVLNFLEFASKLDPRLARSVKISLPPMLAPVLSDLGGRIVNLTLLLPFPENLPILEIMLREKGLPILENIFLENSELRIYQNYYPETGPIRRIGPAEVEEPPQEPLPPHPTLKVIRVKYLAQQVCHGFLQLLLDSAPGLENLEIVNRLGNVYPNLSQKQCLKSLAYTADLGHNQNQWDDSIVFNRPELSRILTEVRGSLQNLELDAIGKFTMGHFYLPHQLPEMPHLFQFTNRRYDVFRCGRNLKELNSQKFPKLRKLFFPLQKFGSRGSLHDLVVGLLEGEENKCGSVTKLEMSISSRAGGGPVFLSRLKIPFPRLEELSLILERNSEASASIWENRNEVNPRFRNLIGPFLAPGEQQIQHGQLNDELQWRVVGNLPQHPEQQLEEDEDEVELIAEFFGGNRGNPPQRRRPAPPDLQSPPISTSLLKAVLIAASTLGLKQLEVTINYRIGFKSLANCLGESSSGLKRLKCLRICLTSELMDEGKNGYFLDEYLLPLKKLGGLNRVEFVNFHVSSTSNLSQDRILEFLTTSKLPVYFL